MWIFGRPSKWVIWTGFLAAALSSLLLLLLLVAICTKKAVNGKTERRGVGEKGFGPPTTASTNDRITFCKSNNLSNLFICPQ